MNNCQIALNVAEKPSVAKKVTELLNKNQLNSVDYIFYKRLNPYQSTIQFSSLTMKLGTQYIQCALHLLEDI